MSTRDKVFYTIITGLILILIFIIYMLGTTPASSSEKHRAEEDKVVFDAPYWRSVVRSECDHYGHRVFVSPGYQEADSLFVVSDSSC